MILPEDENFLLVFRREACLCNSVEFMKVKTTKDVEEEEIDMAQVLSAVW